MRASGAAAPLLGIAADITVADAVNCCVGNVAFDEFIADGCRKIATHGLRRNYDAVVNASVIYPALTHTYAQVTTSRPAQWCPKAKLFTWGSQMNMV